MKGIIYKATNSFNGLSYIGQTIASLNRRRSQHLRDAVSDTVNNFHLALMQYGKEAFEWSVLDEFEGTKEDVIHALNVAEEYHILKHRTMLEEYGYNATRGGYSSDRFAETIKKRALANYGGKSVLQYDLDGNFVREFESIADVKRNFGVTNHKGKHFIGRMWRGYQWREKLNEYYPRKICVYSTPSPFGKGVVVYTIDGKFYKAYSKQKDCWKDLGREYKVRDGFDGVKIQSYLNARYLVFRDNGNYPHEIQVEVVYPKYKAKGIRQNKPVLQYSKEGVFIAEYNSMAEAHRQTGEAHIRQSCKRSLPYQASPQTKSIWRFKGEEIKEKIDVIPVIPHSYAYKRKLEHRILQYDKNGKFIKEYDNIGCASNLTGISASIIRRSLKGKYFEKDAFQWVHYSDNYHNSIGAMQTQRNAGYPVSQYSQSGVLVKVWDNMLQASIQTGESHNLIRKQCLGIPTKKKTPSIWKYYVAV